MTQLKTIKKRVSLEKERTFFHTQTHSRGIDSSMSSVSISILIICFYNYQLQGTDIFIVNPLQEKVTSCALCRPEQISCLLECNFNHTINDY